MLTVELLLMNQKVQHFTRALQRGQATVITSDDERDEFVRELTGGRVTYDSGVERYRSFSGMFISEKDVFGIASESKDFNDITDGTYNYLLLYH